MNWRTTVLIAGTVCMAGITTARGQDEIQWDCDSACVSSLATDEGRRIVPMRYGTSMEAAQRTLANIISRMPGGAVVETTAGFMRAEFRSEVFGLTDDVQFRFDPDGLIQIRSASRLGMYDFGSNQSRLEKIRRGFDAVQP